MLLASGMDDDCFFEDGGCKVSFGNKRRFRASSHVAVVLVIRCSKIAKLELQIVKADRGICRKVGYWELRTVVNLWAKSPGGEVRGRPVRWGIGGGRRTGLGGRSK